MFLLDPGGDQLECRACVGPVDITGLKVPISKGIVGRALTSGQSQMVRDAQADPRLRRQGRRQDRLHHAHSVLCTPLATTRGPIGVLEVLNKRDGGLFDENDRDAAAAARRARPRWRSTTRAWPASWSSRTASSANSQLARELQRSLLPRRRRDGYPVLAVNRPAREISGDFYDYFDLPDGRIAFAIGDVSGKGLDAALLMVRAASLLRWAGKDGLPPRDWLRTRQRRTCRHRRGGHVRLRGGRLLRPATTARDLGQRRISTGAASRRATAPTASIEADGPPLGILPGMDFAAQEADLLGGAALYLLLRRRHRRARRATATASASTACAR